MITRSSVQWQDVEKGNSFNSNGWAIICSTGIQNKCCSKNVFDFSGNCSELTSEFRLRTDRIEPVSRGAMFDSSQGGSSYGPNDRWGGSKFWSISFRPVLYID